MFNRMPIQKFYKKLQINIFLAQPCKILRLGFLTSFPFTKAFQDSMKVTLILFNELLNSNIWNFPLIADLHCLYFWKSSTGSGAPLHGPNINSFAFNWKFLQANCKFSLIFPGNFRILFRRPPATLYATTSF